MFVAEYKIEEATTLIRCTVIKFTQNFLTRSAMTFLALLDAVREANGAFVVQRKSRGTLERPFMSEASFERDNYFQERNVSWITYIS